MLPILGETLVADDICLISLSSVGMQQLLNICDMYAKEHDLLYNGGKSYYYVLNLNVLHLIDLLLLWTVWIFLTSTNLNILAVLLTKLIVTQIWNVKCVNCMLILIWSLGNFLNVHRMWNVFLFKSYCSNSYCSILWYDCSKTALKNLRIR